jgi:energy-coupling factor transport system permease protein
MRNVDLSSLVLGGSYQPGDSILHRMATRSKILWAFIFLIGIALGSGWVQGSLALVLLMALGFSGASLLGFFKRLRAFVWFLLLLGLFPAFFTPGAPVPGLSGLPVSISQEGLLLGGATVLRMVLMFLVSMILLRTTSPRSLVQQIDVFTSWIPWFSEALKQFFLVGLMAFQMLPALCAEAENFLKKEMPENMDRGNIFKRIRQVAQLLMPLLVSVLRDPARFSGPVAGSDQNFIQAESAE